jgi:cytochrome c-type biogenesis protein CcmH/NrfF
MHEPRRLARWVAASLLLAVALSVSIASVHAQSMEAPSAPTSDTQELEINRRARALTDQLMSPWCTGVTITQCSSGIAAGYRDQVRDALRSGLTEEQIKRDFAQQFGENYLAMPRGPVSWLMPLLILAFGAGVLVVLVRRLHASAPEAVEGPSLSADQLRKLEAELDSELRRRNAK